MFLKFAICSTFWEDFGCEEGKRVILIHAKSSYSTSMVFQAPNSTILSLTDLLVLSSMLEFALFFMGDFYSGKRAERAELRLSLIHI